MIFDESPKKAALFADGVASIARQWLLRSGLWKWALAGIGGLLTLLPGLALIPKPSGSLDAVRLDTPVGFVMVIALASVFAVSLTLILAVTWFRFAGRRRA